MSLPVLKDGHQYDFCFFFCAGSVVLENLRVKENALVNKYMNQWSIRKQMNQ